MKIVILKKILIVLSYLVFLALIFGIYIFIEPYWIETKEIKLVDEDIPEVFENKKIVFLTDIHHGRYFSLERVRNLVEKVNKLKPDIILLGGDYVHGDKKYIVPCFEELKKLEATYGKFGVLGNHDHWESAAITKECMKKAGIIILDNKSEWIYLKKSRIKIGGVGDLWEDKQNIDNTIKDVKKEDFLILLSHNPDYGEELKTDKIDYMFCGHTHGGQVTFFGLWAPLLPSRYGQKYRTGIIKTEETTIIVSNGIGTITPPVRFFARPQILVFKLFNHKN